MYERIVRQTTHFRVLEKEEMFRSNFDINHDFGLGAVEIACSYAIGKLGVVWSRSDSPYFRSSFWDLFDMKSGLSDL